MRNFHYSIIPPIPAEICIDCTLLSNCLSVPACPSTQSAYSSPGYLCPKPPRPCKGEKMGKKDRLELLRGEGARGGGGGGDDSMSRPQLETEAALGHKKSSP